MAPGPTLAALKSLATPLRRLALGGVALGAVGAVLLGLAGPAWLVRTGAVRSPLWVIAAWVLALLAAGAAILLSRRTRASLDTRRIAELLEGRPGWRLGSVTGVLDGGATGTSGDLFGAADGACAARLSADGSEALADLRTGLRRRTRAGAALLAVAALLFLGAGPFRHPASALWAPAEAWASFMAPVRLRADRDVVDRGQSVRLDATATGRQTAELWIRGKGETWRSEALPLDSAGRATRTLGPLEGDVYAFVAAGGRSSDTVLVRVRLPAFLGALTLTASYPSYLGLEDEPLPISGDTLLLPAGTRLDVVGEATADLAGAGWRTVDGDVGLEVDGRTFRGGLRPRGSGTIVLTLATRDGAPLGGDPVALPIELVPDRPPEVDLPVPDADTMLVLGADVALVIDARDDHGLQALAIEARRAPRRDTAALSLAAGIPLPPGTTDRALVSPRLDLTPLGLAPGDTVRVVVAARDNSPAGQTGRSRTLVLIVPTENEARAEQRAAQGEIARALDSLVAASRELQRQTEDLSRERDRSQQRDREGSLGFDEAKRAEQVARDQQDLMDAAEEARERLADLENAAERAGIADSAFQRQLEEIRQQLDKALTPELRDRLDKLREALKNLDPQATREALKDLADAQQRLREALERSRELFKRAAVEGELSSLEQEAKQLVEEQKAWNERVERADSNQAAAQESALAARTDSVAQGLDQAAKQLEAERREAMAEAAEQMRQAAQEMRKAARSSQSGKKQEAKEQGEQAAGQLSQAQQQVEDEREAQQQEWRQEVIDALDRALAETARLSQRQLALSTTIGRSSATAASRAEQAMIEEGVQKLLTQITDVSGKNALISPQIGAALVQARLQMARAREAIASASANLREAVDQAGEAVDALNVAAYQMLRSRGDVSGSSSASGLSEAIERMQQLAGQQGSLSQEGNNLLSMLGSPQFQEQLSGLAERQRQVAEELERLRAQGDAPGAAELAEEARELARKLEASRLDPETIARQERLFRRMLDAGRSLQGEEKDESKERESTTARGDSVSVPAPLRRLLDRDGRIRLPSWEELQRLSPEERRLVTDYFRRLTSREGR